MKTVVLLVLFAWASVCGADKPDGVDTLKSHGVQAYCGVLAEFFDDGTWTRSMGIAMEIHQGPNGVCPKRDETDPSKLSRTGVCHAKWHDMTDRERGFYQSAFEAGWKAADKYIAKSPPAELVVDPHDFTGVIPYVNRMKMKQDRFEDCLEHWPPLEV